MLNVADCLVETHHLGLVAVAALVCALAAGTSFSLLPRILAADGRAGAPVWLGLTALVGGAGVWATHFIAVLGFNPAMPIAFEPVPTVLSLVIAVALNFAAFGTLLVSSRRPVRLCAGALLGLATVAMHYTGISGLRAPAEIVWHPGFLAASAAASVLFAVLAVLAGTEGWRGRPRPAAGAALFVVSIVALHFTGMAAISLQPDPARVVDGSLLSGAPLGYAVAAVSLLLIACAVASWLVDRRARADSDARMRFLARHDALTALPNRVLFEEVVERELIASANNAREVALFCLDLDGFKQINDVFGHPTGDRLLVAVARRLQALLGDRCVAARLGGDEFAVLATGFGPSKTPAIAAQAIIDALSAPYAEEGLRVDVGCSVGIAIFPRDGEGYGGLLSAADMALGRAKREGKGTFRFFEAQMDAAARDRHQLATDLRAAIGTDQIELHYQPQFEVASSRPSGFEALMRWTHPTRGAIPPMTFIPIAEETGLILPLGEWCLREACREAASWGAPLGIAVNLSIAQFRQAGLPDLVRTVLRETGLAPQRLELEVTESLFLESTTRSQQILHKIQSLGVRISMDDFGTGYSSLLTLQSFPFDKIKIDRSFVGQIGLAPKGAAIVRAIIALGESLDMPVVAEGIETEEQLAFLQRQRCAEMQGYLRGRPKPIAEYRDLLEAAEPDDTVVRLRRA